MALLNALVTTATIGFKDLDNNIGAFSFYLPGALESTDALAAATFIAQQAAPLSNGVLFTVTLSYTSFDSVAFNAAAPEGSDVERKGVFQFATDNRNLRTKLEIPSLNNIFVQNGTNAIKTDDPLVAAFIASMMNTGLGAANSPITNSGQDLTALYGTPHKIHRGSSKG